MSYDEKDSNGLFRNWRTTSIALVLLCGGFVLVLFNKASLTEVTGFLVAAWGLFVARDIKRND